jgi:hypothetical protein
MHARISLLDGGIWFSLSAKLRPTWLDQTPVPCSRAPQLTTSSGTNMTRPKPQNHSFRREIHWVQSVFCCIYYPDWSSSSGWTLIGHMAIGGNGMQSLLNGCSFFLIDFDRFINPTLQPLKSPLLIGFWHFLKSLLSGFCKKMTTWHNMTNISFLPLY